MIKSFIFENFKSFEKAELYMEDFTTLVGTNSSGKSNAIEGIKILSEIVTGIDLNIILDGSKSAKNPIRGGSNSCCRFKTTAFRLGCLVDLDEEYDLSYDIKISVSDKIYIEEERLYKIRNNQTDRRTGKIFKTKSPISKESGDIKVEYSNGIQGRNPDITCIRTSSILAQMQTKMPRDTEMYIENGKYIDLVIDNLKKIVILNPIPAEMREYNRINDNEIKMNCENISSVLYSVCNNAQSKQKLLDSIANLPEMKVVDIEFIKTKLGDVIFALKEQYASNAEIVDARMLSDGTLRSIAMLATALICEENSVLVVEEIDNGIHPGKVKSLINLLEEICRARKVDVIVTTHNAILLNEYSKNMLIGVSVVYREKQKFTSKFISFIDIEDYHKLIISGGLGDAMVNDSLIRAIKEEKKEQDFSWVVNKE